jgi:hypothetical protein
MLEQRPEEPHVTALAGEPEGPVLKLLGGQRVQLGEVGVLLVGHDLNAT